MIGQANQVGDGEHLVTVHIAEAVEYWIEVLGAIHCICICRVFAQQFISLDALGTPCSGRLSRRSGISVPSHKLVASLWYGSQRHLFTILIDTCSASGHGTAYSKRFCFVTNDASIHDVADAEVERLAVEEEFQFLARHEVILVCIFGRKNLAVDTPAVEEITIVGLYLQGQRGTVFIGCGRCLRSVVLRLLVMVFHSENLHGSSLGEVESDVKCHGLVGLLNP